MIAVSSYMSPFGELILGSFEGALCLADWKYRAKREGIDKRLQSSLTARYVKQETDVIIQAKEQLSSYFSKERSHFDLPLNMVGTSFQQKVWRELLKISYGETRSYLELSKSLGNEKAIRAVATANCANAISIIIPCHRIIGADKSLVGYEGGLPAKQKLLDLENPRWRGQMELF